MWGRRRGRSWTIGPRDGEVAELDAFLDVAPWMARGNELGSAAAGVGGRAVAKDASDRGREAGEGGGGGVGYVLSDRGGAGAQGC
jgi:hypothetical protein